MLCKMIDKKFEESKLESIDFNKYLVCRDTKFAMVKYGLHLLSHFVYDKNKRNLSFSARRLPHNGSLYGVHDW